VHLTRWLLTGYDNLWFSGAGIFLIAAGAVLRFAVAAVFPARA